MGPLWPKNKHSPVASDPVMEDHITVVQHAETPLQGTTGVCHGRMEGQGKFGGKEKGGARTTSAQQNPITAASLSPSPFLRSMPACVGPRRPIDHQKAYREVREKASPRSPDWPPSHHRCSVCLHGAAACFSMVGDKIGLWLKFEVLNFGWIIPSHWKLQRHSQNFKMQLQTTKSIKQIIPQWHKKGSIQEEITSSWLSTASCSWGHRIN